MHGSLQITEKKFHEKYDGVVNLLPKITMFEKIPKNTNKQACFCHFSFKQGWKKINSKNCF